MNEAKEKISKVRDMFRPDSSPYRLLTEALERLDRLEAEAKKPLRFAKNAGGAPKS